MDPLHGHDSDGGRTTRPPSLVAGHGMHRVPDRPTRPDGPGTTPRRRPPLPWRSALRTTDLVREHTWLPKVSVVVATHNRPQLLRVALAAISRRTTRRDRVHPRVRPGRARDRPRAGAHRYAGAVGQGDHQHAHARTRRRTQQRHHGRDAASSSRSATTTTNGSRARWTAQVEASHRSGAFTSVTGIPSLRRPRDGAASRPRSVSSELLRSRVMEAHPSSVVVRRDALLGPIGLVDEEIPGSYAEDFDWILRAARGGPDRRRRARRWSTCAGVSRCSPGTGRRSSTPSTTCSPSTRYSRNTGGARPFAGPAGVRAARSAKHRQALGHGLVNDQIVGWARAALYLAAAVALRLVSAERLMAFPTSADAGSDRHGQRFTRAGHGPPPGPARRSLTNRSSSTFRHAQYSARQYAANAIEYAMANVVRPVPNNTHTTSGRKIVTAPIEVTITKGSPPG